MALTELAIKNLKTTGKLYRVADSGGLTLEVSAAGSKLWRLAGAVQHGVDVIEQV